MENFETNEVMETANEEIVEAEENAEEVMSVDTCEPEQTGLSTVAKVGIGVIGAAAGVLIVKGAKKAYEKVGVPAVKKVHAWVGDKLDKHDAKVATDVVEATVVEDSDEDFED